MGIYLGLSVLDFPFCFLAVKWFGTERIAEIEHAIIDGFWGIVEKGFPALKEKREHKQELERLANEATREGDGAGIVEYAQGNGKVEEPSELAHCRHGATAYLLTSITGIWTQLLLAYGVHKSLIFFRIPLTLAVTPKVVKTLRKWGWNIGKTKPK